MFSLKSKMKDEQTLIQQILKEKDALIQKKEKFDKEQRFAVRSGESQNQKLKEKI